MLFSSLRFSRDQPGYDHSDDSKKYDLSTSVRRKTTFKVRAAVIIEEAGVRTIFNFIDPEYEFQIFWYNPQLRDLDPKNRKAR